MHRCRILCRQLLCNALLHHLRRSSSRRHAHSGRRTSSRHHAHSGRRASGRHHAHSRRRASGRHHAHSGRWASSRGHAHSWRWASQRLHTTHGLNAQFLNVRWRTTEGTDTRVLLWNRVAVWRCGACWWLDFLLAHRRAAEFGDSYASCRIEGTLLRVGRVILFAASKVSSHRGILLRLIANGCPVGGLCRLLLGHVWCRALFRCGACCSCTDSWPRIVCFAATEKQEDYAGGRNPNDGKTTDNTADNSTDRRWLRCLGWCGNGLNDCRG